MLGVCKWGCLSGGITRLFALNLFISYYNKKPHRLQSVYNLFTNRSKNPPTYVIMYFVPDGIPWTVHLANMYMVIAKEEMSDDEVQKVVDSTLEGRIYNG